jgi:non-ribosomal peptide synthetase component F
MADGSFDRKVAYWREALGTGQPISLPSALQLPATDREHEPGMVQYDIPTEIGALLREIAMCHRTTLFSAIFAAFSGYLAVCTGQRNIVVPVFFANRTRKQVRRTVGYISNLLLIPIDLTDQPPFSELVHRAMRIILKAIANQDVPYHVVPLPGNEFERRRHPELVLDYFKIDGNDALELAELEVRSYDLDGATGAKFAVEFHFVERNDGLKVACVYAADHTCASAIAGFLDGFADFCATGVAAAAAMDCAIHQGNRV